MGRKPTYEELKQKVKKLEKEIVNRERTEKTRQESEIVYHTLFESANDAIFIEKWDCFIDCNTKALEMFGCTRDQLIGNTFDHFSPERQPDGQLTRKKGPAILKLAEEGKPQFFEWQHKRLDGTLFDAEVSLNRMDLSGETYLLAITRDITERKEVERALEENETRYRTLFESANDAILLNKGPRWVECNKKTLEMFGCNEKEEIIGKTFYDFSPERQPDGNLSKDKGDEKRKLAEEAKPPFFEWKHKRIDGTVFDVEVSLNRIELSGEVFILSIVRDITERKQAEESLRKAFKEIEQLKEQIQADYTYLREEIKLTHHFDEIIGQSGTLQYVLFKVEQIAPTDTAVLILGETGVGKELIARAIHNSSPRKQRPLVKVNCATLPSNLIESELFGHEKGAFTGAHAKQVGRFEFASGSTIFLDEVGELTLELQGKLLGVLQDGAFERLGSPRTIQTDVRVITATNRDLEEEVRKGRFRQDLWYRLNVFPITVPPLRARKEDIPLLVNSFVKRFSRKVGRHIEQIPQTAMKALQNHHWPGNIRELENVIERAVINTQGPVLRLTDKLQAPNVSNRTMNLVEIEHDHIVQVLEKANWKIEGKNGAASMLGLNPSTLRGRMRKLGIRRKGPTIES